MHRLLVSIALLAGFCHPLSVIADPAAPPRPSNLRSDILYTHRGEFVQVSPMRPLTLNAHVEQFAYDPLGLEIAIVGSEPQGDQTLHFVKTLDARTGKEISRLSLLAPADDMETSFSLIGWSGSGKYLLLKQYTPNPKEPKMAMAAFLRWDISANPPITRMIDPESGLPPELQSEDLEGSANGYPSPDGRWIVFAQSILTVSENGKQRNGNAYVLYNFEHDTFKLLTLPPKSIFTDSWADQMHLKLVQHGVSQQLDVVTGEVSPLPTSSDASPPIVSKQYPDLSLDFERQTVQDRRVKGSEGQVSASIVWIRRSPFGSLPLGVAAAGLMPQESTDTAPTWSPTGKQIAFIAHSDLYITDLIPATDLLPNEKTAVGLKLSCAEEQVLAMSDLKQIGLGIIQYLQDEDEKYPIPDGFVQTIYPYIKSMDVFQVDGHHFVYEQPAASLAQVESPATTENGYMDLPCARVVLFADGHVKAFVK